MSKRNHQSKHLSVKFSVRFSTDELFEVKTKATKANLSTSEFIRQIAGKGIVFAKANHYDLNEVRQLKELLLGYRTNFSRISNYIKHNNPSLNKEIEYVIKEINMCITKITL